MSAKEILEVNQEHLVFKVLFRQDFTNWESRFSNTTFHTRLTAEDNKNLIREGCLIGTLVSLGPNYAITPAAWRVQIFYSTLSAN